MTHPCQGETIKQTYAIGLGTGRCGTRSFAAMLDRLDGVSVTHELVRDDDVRIAPLLPWERDPEALERAIEALDAQPENVAGDVASFWLPYIDDMIALVGDRFRGVVLHRPCEEVVPSFLNKAGIRNHWTDHRGIIWKPSEYDVMFPSYHGFSRPAAIARYCAEYQTQVRRLADRYPEQIMVMDYRAALDPAGGHRQVLEFLGIDGEPASGGASHLNSSPDATRGQRPRVIRQWMAWRVPALHRAWIGERSPADRDADSENHSPARS